MKKGICCAGNMIVDITYPIETWPKQNELTHITEGITRSTGGSVCNTISDLARLDPALPLVASGFAGHDAEGDFVLQEMGKYKNIDLSMVKRSGDTSFTAVMSNNQTKERTFFQYAGGNAYYGERFKRLVTPALRYTDYCIINELETQQTTGVLLRGEDGTLHVENMKAALQKLHELGVAKWAVIHCPELGCGMDEAGNYCEFESLKLPKGYIKGTVGAGDAFCAGVLYAAETDMPLREALKLGACSAAASLSEVSASDGVKTKDEVLKLYELYGK